MRTYQNDLNDAAYEKEDTAGHTTLDVHAPNSLGATTSIDNPRLTAVQQERLVNKIVNDTRNSPSKYHTPRVAQSNIPESRSATHRLTKSHLQPHYANGMPMASRTTSGGHSTPRKGSEVDLLETQAHKFTNHKP